MEILKDDGILLQQNVSNWEEAIRNVAAPLLKNKNIEPSYIEAMINSVKNFGPYIVIAPHLALAHARPEDGVNKSGLTVETLKKPVNFGNELTDSVNIIFCLATTDSNSHLGIIKELVALINDQKKLSKLMTLTDVEEFKKILCQK